MNATHRLFYFLFHGSSMLSAVAVLPTRQCQCFAILCPTWSLRACRALAPQVGVDLPSVRVHVALTGAALQYKVASHLVPFLFFTEPGSVLFSIVVPVRTQQGFPSTCSWHYRLAPPPSTCLFLERFPLTVISRRRPVKKTSLQGDCCRHANPFPRRLQLLSVIYVIFIYIAE